MHNLKDIRKDFTVFAKSLEKRSINLDIKNLQKLDEQNRQLIQQKEALEKEKKEISKSKLIDLFSKDFAKPVKSFLISFKLCICIF